MANYQLPDGRSVSDSMAFTLNEIQYPSNWLLLSTEYERSERGITGPLPEPAWYDQRFYWAPDQPKDHLQLVHEYIGHIKRNAGSMLSDTDWYITRMVETGVGVPQAVLDRRAEIRACSNTKEQAILATTSTDELAAYVTSAEYGLWEPDAPSL